LLFSTDKAIIFKRAIESHQDFTIHNKNDGGPAISPFHHHQPSRLLHNSPPMAPQKANKAAKRATKWGTET
jgi:hypothetical protein